MGALARAVHPTHAGQPRGGRVVVTRGDRRERRARQSGPPLKEQDQQQVGEAHRVQHAALVAAQGGLYGRR